MEISVDTKKGLERHLTITIPADRIEQDILEELGRLSKTAKLKGFRPGKVPLDVLKLQYGESVRVEVLEKLMKSSLFEALQKENLNPAGMPAIIDVKDSSGEPLEFVASFEVYPEIKLANMEKVTIERPVAEITDADFEKMLTSIQQQHSDWVDVDRASKDGDKVIIDFEGTIDGVAFEGGQAQEFPVEIGSGQMLKEFDKALNKVKVNSEVEAKVNFPKDYHGSDVAGKKAIFKITVKKVQEPVLPELNDEFVKRIDEKATLESFKDDVKKNMERELDRTIKSRIKNAVMDKLLEKNGIDLPKALLDRQIDALRKQALSQFQGMTEPDKMPEIPADILEEQATKQVSLGLLIAEFVKEHEIKVDEDRVRQTIDELAKSYQDPEQVVRWYYGNKDRLQEMEFSVLEEQVVDKLLEMAKIKDKSMTYDELVNES